MIELRGTSHIAGRDIDRIRAAVREKQPDVVALELDYVRLQALLGNVDRKRSLHPFFLLMRLVQVFLGRKTGTEPGADMLAAYRAAVANGIDVALVDQEIGVTVQRLKQVPLLEKLKFVGYLLVGSLGLPLVAVSSGSFRLDEVPDRELVERLLLQFEVSFPRIYEVLVAERNEVMAAHLQDLAAEHGHVLAFVGMGHVDGLQELLEGAEPV